MSLVASIPQHDNVADLLREVAGALEAGGYSMRDATMTVVLKSKRSGLKVLFGGEGDPVAGAMTMMQVAQFQILHRMLYEHDDD